MLVMLNSSGPAPCAPFARTKAAFIDVHKASIEQTNTRANRISRQANPAYRGRSHDQLNRPSIRHMAQWQKDLYGCTIAMTRCTVALHPTRSGQLLQPHVRRHRSTDVLQDHIPIVARAGILHRAIHGHILHTVSLHRCRGCAATYCKENGIAVTSDLRRRKLDGRGSVGSRYPVGCSEWHTIDQRPMLHVCTLLCVSENAPLLSGQMPCTPHHVTETLLLPESTLPTDQLIDSLGSVRLPAVHDPG